MLTPPPNTRKGAMEGSSLTSTQETLATLPPAGPNGVGGAEGGDRSEC